MHEDEDFAAEETSQIVQDHVYDEAKSFVYPAWDQTVRYEGQEMVDRLRVQNIH